MIHSLLAGCRNLAAIATLTLVLISAAHTSNSPEAVIPPFTEWQQFIDELEQLWPQTASKLPPDMRQDPQIQQELGRLMLAAIAARSLDALSADGDHPWFLPHLGLTMNVFQPNADTVYRNANITPGGSYRIRGRAGSLSLFKMAQFGPTPVDTGKGVRAFDNHDFATLTHDEHGQFDVLLSVDKPRHYSGDWWPLNPNTEHLMVRMVSADWAHEQDPTLAIERLDSAATKGRPSADKLRQRLVGLAPRIKNSATFLVDHAVQLRQEGYINRLKVFDVVTNLGGLYGQFYYEGAYELTRHEALIVETTVPKQCAYSSLILTNDIYETTDWYNNHSSLNHSQVHVDDDEVLRIVISHQDPGIANWLDTAGYPRGVIQGRWTDCTSQPVPTIQKVALSELMQYLPSDTARVSPEQRDHIIRERRAALQQRPLW